MSWINHFISLLMKVLDYIRGQKIFYKEPESRCFRLLRAFKHLCPTTALSPGGMKAGMDCTYVNTPGCVPVNCYRTGRGPGLACGLCLPNPRVRWCGDLLHS